MPFCGAASRKEQPSLPPLNADRASRISHCHLQYVDISQRLFGRLAQANLEWLRCGVMRMASPLLKSHWRDADGSNGADQRLRFMYAVALRKIHADFPQFSQDGFVFDELGYGFNSHDMADAVN